jgi:DNA-binding MarR family transcriptional regulator
VADLWTAYRRLMADVYELAGSSRRLSDREAVRQGTTVTAWHALSVVAHAPATVPAIARRLGLVRQSVQPVIDTLHADGAVTTQPNPRHARSPLIAITPRGDATLDKLWQQARKPRVAALAEAGITAEALAQAQETLAAVLKALEP